MAVVLYLSQPGGLKVLSKELGDRGILNSVCVYVCVCVCACRSLKCPVVYK